MTLEKFLLIIVFFITYTVGFFSGVESGRTNIQKEAVIREFGFYSVDKNNNLIFSWKNK